MDRFLSNLGWGLFGVVLALLAGCGSSAQVDRVAGSSSGDARVTQELVSNEEEKSDLAPVTRRFVLVSSASRLYTAPDRTAPFVHLVDSKHAERLQVQRTQFLERRWEDHQADTAKKEAARADKIKRKRSRRPRGKRKRARWKAARAKEREAEAERAERLRLEEGHYYADLYRSRAAANPEEAPQRRFGVFRLVRFGTDWVEVETASELDSQSHCYDAGLSSLQPLALRFFVHREDIQTVFRKRRSYSLWKLSQIEVIPGVAWVDGEARADGYRVPIKDVPRDDIGATYEAAQVYESPMTEIALSDRSFAERNVKIGRRRQLTINPYATPYVVATARQGKRHFATVQSRCVELTVVVRQQGLVAAPQQDRTRIQMESESVTGPSIVEGTRVLWPNGDRAGVAHGPFFLGSQTVSHPTLACYRRALWSGLGMDAQGRSRALTLCVEKRDVMP